MLAKQGESLVHFDHVLDVVGRGYQLAVDFAHVPLQLTLAMTQHFSLTSTESLSLSLSTHE